MANSLEKFYLNKVKSMPPVEVTVAVESKKHQKSKLVPRGKKVSAHHSQKIKKSRRPGSWKL